MEPKFSICIITKNEAKTLPRLLKSLKEFRERNGEVIIVDTGSTDNTVEIAQGEFCNVTMVGEKFITILDEDTAKIINEKFVVEGEPNVVQAGKKFFDFSAARNYCASLAKNDMISCADADEMFTSLDIDKLNQLIDEGNEQFEYNFVYAHDSYGREAIKFIQSKFYNRTKCKWVNRVHEVLAGDAKRLLLDENIIKLEHHQQPAEHRGNYLSGLAYDCYLNPDNDRNCHYFARELMYCGRPKSAIECFMKHVSMNRWPAEKAQSLIFIGDCYGMLNQPEMQVKYYNEAIFIDGTRREAFIKLARFYKHNNNPLMVVAYTQAAMQIPWVPFYANDKGMYEHEPHELLYWAYGWLGKIKEAQEHLLKANEFRPFHPDYLRDASFYFERKYVGQPKISIIIPQLGRPEGLKRMLDSIKNSDYPQYLIQTIVIEGPETVPQKVAIGLQKSHGDFIVFAANDTELLPDSLSIAVRESLYKNKALAVFDTGVRNTNGYICEHFMIYRPFVFQKLGGVIFDLDFHHACADDLLWHKCNKSNEAFISTAQMKHHHFSRIGSNIEQDSINKKAYAYIEEDRELLEKKLQDLYINQN